MDIDLQFASWSWALSLIALTIAVHAAGLVMIAFVLVRTQLRVENWSLGGSRHTVPVVISIIGAVGLLLAMLHGTEAAIWAAAYLWLGALASPSEAMLYSVDSITTRGASGLMLPAPWRMMGALEAADGMLLFGISTASIFAVMQAFWPLLSRRSDAASEQASPRASSRKNGDHARRAAAPRRRG